MTSPPALRSRLRHDGDRTTIVLSGEIDMNVTPQLDELLRTTIRASRAVEVDIADVHFIDSTVISVLIVARNAAMAMNCRLSVVNPTAQVRRVLEVTGVLDALSA